jgi:lipopolysaccharide transport system permease protein
MAADETVYSAERLLSSPRRFAADARADLRVVPGAAWLMWLRGLQARHRQSRLGYGWAVAPALAVALTWVYLDDVRIVRFGDVGIPYLAYVLAGVLLWQTFSDALHAPLRRLQGAREIVTKARLPHETWVLAGALDVVFDLLLRLAVLVVVLVAVGAPVDAALALAPLGLVALLVLGLAIGLAIAPVGLLYEDVGRALTLVTGFWFFLTPVVYPWPSDLPGTALVEANPVTPVLVTTRAWLTGAPGAEPLQLAAVAAAGVLLLLAAWVVYRLSRPHLVARL